MCSCHRSGDRLDPAGGHPEYAASESIGLPLIMRDDQGHHPRLAALADQSFDTSSRVIVE